MGFSFQMSTLTPARSETFGLDGYRELTSADAEMLLDHYLALKPDQRRVRFGGMMSAAALASVMRQRDWDASWTLGFFKNGLLHGVVEMFATRTDGWRRCELALTCLSMRDTDRLRDELLQLAIFEARERRTEEMVVQFVTLEPWMLNLCAGRACKRTEDQIAVSLLD